MIYVTALFHPKAGRRDDVLAVLERTIPLVHEEPGCALYAAFAATDGESIALIEAWESAELLDAHGDGEPVRQQRAELADLLDGPIEVQRYTELPLGDPLRGALHLDRRG